MEVTIQVSPELFNNGQAITIRREDQRPFADDHHQNRRFSFDTNQRPVRNLHREIKNELISSNSRR